MPRPAGASSLRLTVDEGDRSVRVRTTDGRLVYVRCTRLKERGQRIVLSSVLPAPLFALRVGTGLRINCDESAMAGPGFARSALYVDAERPQTRLPYMLLTARAGSHSFDVGHRPGPVRRVSVVFAEEQGPEMCAWIAELNLEILVNKGPELVVCLVTRDDDAQHIECICS